METILKKVDIDNIDKADFSDAASILRADGLVAFPTETVYGLGANALSPLAASKIYAAKGRPSDNPLIVHIADKKDIYELSNNVTDKAVALAKAFWPGPLTIILEKSEIVPMTTTGGLDTVAIRMPNHKVALKLIKEAGVYIAAPSANTSGKPSPTSAAHVYEDMNGRIDMIIDGGSGYIGLESTIVDLSDEVPMILRPGCITKEMLEEVIGTVEVDKAILGIDNSAKPKAPGMKYKHYAPKGELAIVEGDVAKVIAYINEKAAANEKEDLKTAVLATSENVFAYEADYVYDLGSRENEDAVARHLYAALRRCDELDMDYIYAESFENQAVGQAIMNRLIKAAGHNIIRL